MKQYQLSLAMWDGDQLVMDEPTMESDHEYELVAAAERLSRQTNRKIVWVIENSQGEIVFSNFGDSE